MQKIGFNIIQDTNSVTNDSHHLNFISREETKEGELLLSAHSPVFGKKERHIELIKNMSFAPDKQEEKYIKRKTENLNRVKQLV